MPDEFTQVRVLLASIRNNVIRLNREREQLLAEIKNLKQQLENERTT